MVEKIAERPDKARTITKARVKDMIITDGACTGCIDEKGGVDFKEFGPVILPVEDSVPISLGILCWQRTVQICCTFPQRTENTAPVVRSRWARLSVQKSST